MALSVVIVDDHTMLRQGLRRALESEGVMVVGEAADGAEGMRVALATHPDVVLMDVSMPGLDGIDATRQLVAADGRMRVVMLTMHIDRDVIDRAIKAGAVGYLTKDSSISEVVEAIAAGRQWRPPDVTPLSGGDAHRSPAGHRRHHLQPRGGGAATRRRRTGHHRDREPSCSSARRR